MVDLLVALRSTEGSQSFRKRGQHHRNKQLLHLSSFWGVFYTLKSFKIKPKWIWREEDICSNARIGQDEKLVLIIGTLQEQTFLKNIFN